MTMKYLKYTLILCLLWPVCILFSQEVRSNKVEFQLRNLPDTMPPTITILSPAIEQGLSHQTLAVEIAVVWEVTDESQLRYVTINADKMQVDASGHFSKRIALYPGENRIRLTASDIYHNIQELYLHIESIPQRVSFNQESNTSTQPL